MLEYTLCYLFIAVVSFFCAYCYGAEMNFRLGLEDGFPKYFIKGFHLLIYDFFKLHCPWSWKVAKKYRLANMREFLGSEGRCHEIGHITAVDCDDIEQQEKIARHTFVSRKVFWAKGASQFLAMPIVVVLLVVVGVVFIFLSSIADLRLVWIRRAKLNG